MKLFVRTFGCRANAYDSEMVRAMAIRGGHEIVDDPAAADLAVVNTCAVTAEAERDARRAVRQIAGVNPHARTIVMGCAGALPASAARLRDLPTVATVVPGNDAPALAHALGLPAAAPATEFQQSVRAVLRVQDGCDEHCTFCATTMARGANRSRPEAQLLLEAQALAAHHPEIVITGTHIGTYGADIGSSLGVLIERLVAAVPGARFRLSSLEATEVDDRLADLFGGGSRLVPHLHAPLQSGSDRLLRRMGRHWYTARSYADAIERLAKRATVFGFGADLIAGFPGETDEDHQATVSLVEQLPFTYLHVFTYSPRPGTASTRLPSPVPLADAQARSHELRHLGQKKGREYQATRAGTEADIIVVSGGADPQGITEDYLTVAVESPHRRGERFRATLTRRENSLAAA